MSSTTYFKTSTFSSLIDSGLHRRRRHRTPSCDSAEEGIKDIEMLQLGKKDEEDARWKRILLLIVAITVHNIPEGLAVGVGKDYCIASPFSRSRSRVGSS